jgi:REP element-mobilizing transposase RayT
MPQSLSKVYLHTVFSTKNRKPLIRNDIEGELYAFIGATVKNLGGIPIKINGMPDHIHILSTLPRTVSISKFIEEIKKGSSKWIKTKGWDFSRFYWQNGYATFSVSSSNIEVVRRYIENQKMHHAKVFFKDEVIRFLKNYKVDYDERYLWD